MSTKKLAQQLDRFAQERRALVSAFLEASPLIAGSVTQTKGRCGKPQCACAQKPSHEIALLMTYENGKRTSKLIRKNDVEEVLNQWHQYKTLKEKIARLRKLNQQEIELLQQAIEERKRTYEPQ